MGRVVLGSVNTASYGVQQGAVVSESDRRAICNHGLLDVTAIALIPALGSTKEYNRYVQYSCSIQREYIWRIGVCEQLPDGRAMAGKFHSHVLVPNVYNLVLTRKHQSNLDVMVRETAE